MTYQDHFVVEVKSNGKILRVKDGAVYLPYGSEYTLLLKNLNSKRASVSISIDSEDVLDHHRLIIDPLETFELQGFLKGNVAKNHFKFIQKTKQIQDHRGDKVGDGLIRVEFAFEKPQPKPEIENIIKEVHHHYHNPIQYSYYGSGCDWYTVNNSGQDDNTGVAVDNTRGVTAQNAAFCCQTETLGMTPNIDEGITVKGSECHQSFVYGSIGELEESTVIIIQLKGEVSSGTVVQQPITVQTKLTCSSCGVRSKSSFKFCPNCGTFLE